MRDGAHKFRRGRYKTGTYYFKCVDSGCSYLVIAALAVGKMCRCVDCDKPFALTRNDVKWAKPRCEPCRHKPKRGVRRNAMDDLFKEIL